MEWNNGFLISIIINGLLTLAVVAIVLVWAVKTGQFKNQKRVSKLPLEIEE